MVRGDFGELEETSPARIRDPGTPKNIVILVTSPTMGHENPGLGKRLMKFFFQALINQQVKPRAVILMNTAVTMACLENEMLGRLAILEEQEVKILLDAISVDEMGLEDKVKIGTISDMETITEHLLAAWKVISL
ncbi:MAG: hypothetical protein J7M18_08015 [Candidatus Eremiobacteraeota bacterium]|nr:hypothetical protein [Candidatus Eremiobacteraeota bacterium]